MSRFVRVSLLICLALAHSAGQADPAQNPEIEALLQGVGRSDCTFIRNGAEHSAQDAEAHLRMKYRRGKRYVKTAEDFISRIASKSSWTGKPYQVECAAHAPQNTENWLTDRLVALRAQ